jgi:hypothetical protein
VPAAPLVTFHLFRVATRRIPAAVARMALDRRGLRATPGLSFFKLVGTGRGQTFSVRDADPRHWGLLAVWDGRTSLERFEAGSPVRRAWARLAAETWRVDLAPVRSRGAWSGRDPFAVTAPGSDDGGPVVAITRARIRWRRARRFWRAVPPVVAELHRRPGLLLSFGIGEAPVGLQGTFSLWESSRALTGYAYDSSPHRAAIRATQELDWYAEELFARFAVVGAAGTAFGLDPLAGRLPTLADDA